MKCEIRIIARDIKQAIYFLPTWGGIVQFLKILSAEALVIVPVSVLGGINTVFVAVAIFISACAVLVYYNASIECKTKKQEGGT